MQCLGERSSRCCRIIAPVRICLIPLHRNTSTPNAASRYISVPRIRYVSALTGKLSAQIRSSWKFSPERCGFVCLSLSIRRIPLPPRADKSAYSDICTEYADLFITSYSHGSIWVKTEEGIAINCTSNLRDGSIFELAL